MQSVPCTKKARSGAVQAKGAGAEDESDRAGLGLAGNHNRFHVVAGLRRAIVGILFVFRIDDRSQGIFLGCIFFETSDADRA